MGRFAAVLAIGLFAFVGVAQADFTGPYAPGNWTWFDNASGTGTLDATTMFIIGGDAGMAGYSEYNIAVPAGGTLDFDWSYFSVDDPGYDWGYYSVNGVQTMLADTSPASGNASVPVMAGDVFALGVETSDGGWGPGELTVTNFIPEPASLALLALGALALRRR